jgi:uncharacterized protein
MKHFPPEAPEGLVIDIARLDRDGETVQGEIPASVLDYDPGDILFQPAGPLRYDLHVQQLGGELLVRGKVSEDFTCVCVRCGRDFPWTASDGEVTFSLEIGSEEFADLTEELRECIILSFPSNPLCSEDCKGLCPHCGADLNKGPCHCRPTEGGDLRWGGLDGLDSGGR